MLNISVEEKNDVWVVSASGILDVLTRSRLREAKCLHAPSGDCVLSLREVEFIDSSALSTLVQIIRRFRDSGHKFLLVAPPDHVLSVLQVTSIDQIVPIMSSIDEGLEWIERSRDTGASNATGD